MIVYIVYGITGEYEDYIEWSVKGYLDEIQAQEFCDILNSIASRYSYKEWREDPYNKSIYELKEEVENDLKHYDPEAYIDYTGTTYNIKTIEVIE